MERTIAEALILLIGAAMAAAGKEHHSPRLLRVGVTVMGPGSSGAAWAPSAAVARCSCIVRQGLRPAAIAVPRRSYRAFSSF